MGLIDVASAALEDRLKDCHVLTEPQLKRLADHKYSSSGNTLLDPYMQKFWNWFILRVPLWLAPNLMTILGLAVNLLTCLILIYYSPNAKEKIPGWAIFLCGVGLFVYQTLDACDGKQARRTNTSSQLGELFDHGCDAISTAFIALSACLAVQMGDHPSWMFIQVISASALFYTAHWQTFVSGQLRFGYFDVTEAQFAIMAVFLSTAIFGQGFWDTQVPFLSNTELKLLPIWLTLASACMVAYGYLVTIFTGGVGKNGSTVAGTSVLSPSIPIALVVIPAYIIYQKSPSNLYENHPCLYLITFCLVIMKITNKLVICHMTRSEMDYLDSSMIAPLLLFLNQYFNCFISEHIVLWMAFLYSLFDFLKYSSVVCLQIANFLRIRIFLIRPRDPSGPLGSGKGGGGGNSSHGNGKQASDHNNDKLSDDEMERDNSSVILVNGHISGDTSGSDSSESLDESCRPLDLNDDSSVQRVGRRKKKKVTTRSHIVTAGHRSPIPLERHVIVDIGNVEGDLKEAKLIDISTPVPPLITPTPSEEEDQNQVLTMPNQQNTTILITKQLSEVDLTT